MDKSVLLYYFSGTGNSKRLAEVAAQRFIQAGARVKVQNIEENGSAEEHNDYTCHGFIFPVYSFGIPRIMSKFMSALPPGTGKEAFIVVSTSNEEYWLKLRIPPTEGRCLGQGRRILEKRGYKVIGLDTVPMPNNWIAGWSAPPPERAIQIIEDGEKAVSEFAEKIMGGKIYLKKSHWLSKLLGLINPFFLYGMSYMHLLFYVDDNCNSCEICAKTCPVANIKIVNDRPKWGKACEQCFRCLNLCPEESIQAIFIGTTKKRRRYKEPHLSVKDLISIHSRE